MPGLMNCHTHIVADPTQGVVDQTQMKRKLLFEQLTVCGRC